MQMPDNGRKCVQIEKQAQSWRDAGGRVRITSKFDDIADNNKQQSFSLSEAGEIAEREMIKCTLKMYYNNVSYAAAALGISWTHSTAW